MKEERRTNKTSVFKVKACEMFRLLTTYRPVKHNERPQIDTKAIKRVRFHTVKPFEIIDRAIIALHYGESTADLCIF